MWEIYKLEKLQKKKKENYKAKEKTRTTESPLEIKLPPFHLPSHRPLKILHHCSNCTARQFLSSRLDRFSRGHEPCRHAEPCFVDLTRGPVLCKYDIPSREEKWPWELPPRTSRNDLALPHHSRRSRGSGGLSPHSKAIYRVKVSPDPWKKSPGPQKQAVVLSTTTPSLGSQWFTPTKKAWFEGRRVRYFSS